MGLPLPPPCSPFQSGCLRCAQGERCADSVGNEPDKACKRKRNSEHPVINEWLGDVSDEDDDDYSDLEDFIEKKQKVDQYDDLWETTDHPKDTKGWLELQAKVAGRAKSKRRRIE